MELAYRAAIVKANLNFRKRRISDEFSKSYTYISLDPTEKGAVSYFLGSTISKYVSKELYEVDWLLHVDIYGPNYAFSVPGGIKPDFFGIDHAGHIHVVESKGSSGMFSTIMHKKALKQAKQKFTTFPKKVMSRNAVQAHFNRLGVNGVLRCRIEDPEAEGEEIQISFNPSRLVEIYYHDIFQTCSNFGISNDNYVIADIGNGVSVGMEIDLYKKYMNKAFQDIFQDYLVIKDSETPAKPNDQFHMGKDGVCILLDDSFFITNPDLSG